MLTESDRGAPLNGLAVTNGYDSFLRRSALGLNTQPGTLTRYGYDNAGRLAGVTNGNHHATYSYLEKSPLVGQIAFNDNTTTRMTTTKAYDKLNRLTRIESSGAGVSPASSFDYQYNSANQRVREKVSPIKAGGQRQKVIRSRFCSSGLSSALSHGCEDH